MPDVRRERTEWRDLSISKWHRKWGWDCPAVDIDFLLLEYDNGQPVALVEYKHESAKQQFASHPTYQAMINLGTRASIPVFAARYKGDFSEFFIVPLNVIAKKIQSDRIAMTERKFVTFLYKLRGRTPPEQLFEDANVEI